MSQAKQASIFVNIQRASSNNEINLTTMVKDYLLNNLDKENLNLDHLCRHLGMSKSKLYRKLKAKSNKSINIYIRSFRLQTAKKLLITTNLNVSEVCYQVGFKDLSYFSRSFSKEFGFAPSKIKEQRC